MISWATLSDLYPAEIVARTERVAKFVRLCGLELEDFQKLIVAESLLVPEIAVALPRGNGKTTLFAGVGMSVMHDEPNSPVFVAAAKQDQAKILFDLVKTYSERKYLTEKFSSTIGEIRHTNGSRLKALSSDMGGKGHGTTPRLSLVDELHAHIDGRTYVAQKTAQKKRPDARLVSISTMGAVRKGPWWELDQAALLLPTIYEDDWFTLRRNERGTFSSLRWALPDDIDPDAVTGADLKRVNPASWITAEMMDDQLDSPGLPREIALAYHGNLWPNSSISWLAQGTWSGLLDVHDAAVPDGAELILAIDRGTQSDKTGILGLWTGPDGIVRERHWLIPSPSLQDEILNKVRSIRDQYKVLACGYDPWQMGDIADILEREGLPMVKHTMATGPRARSSQELYELLVGGNFRHDGSPDLTLHINNSVGRQVREGFVIDKDASGSEMDLVIAFLIANHIRLELTKHASVYARKELLIL